MSEEKCGICRFWKGSQVTRQALALYQKELILLQEKVDSYRATQKRNLSVEEIESAEFREEMRKASILYEKYNELRETIADRERKIAEGLCRFMPAPIAKHSSDWCGKFERSCRNGKG